MTHLLLLLLDVVDTGCGLIVVDLQEPLQENDPRIGSRLDGSFDAAPAYLSSFEPK